MTSDMTSSPGIDVAVLG